MVWSYSRFDNKKRKWRLSTTRKHNRLFPSRRVKKATIRTIKRIKWKAKKCSHLSNDGRAQIDCWIRDVESQIKMTVLAWNMKGLENLFQLKSLNKHQVGWASSDIYGFCLLSSYLLYAIYIFGFYGNGYGVSVVLENTSKINAFSNGYKEK